MPCNDLNHATAAKIKFMNLKQNYELTMNHKFFIVTGELDWSQPKRLTKLSDLKLVGDKQNTQWKQLPVLPLTV